MADLGGLDVQQVHGDLHLGQTLRTSIGWKIVDFEGEPAKPLAERAAARLALARRGRDAAQLRLRRPRGRALARPRRGPGRRAGRDAGRGVVRAQQEPLPPRLRRRGAHHGPAQALLDAYVADKAVYETVYETRNRPSWVGIPLQAVARIGAS